MKMNVSAVAGAALALALAAGPAAAQTTTPQKANVSPTRESALAALQDARVTIGRLAEESMDHAVRQAYDQLSSDFRGLYKAYTGHEPDERKSAITAGQQAPASDWQTRYEAVNHALDRLVGPAPHDANQAATTTASNHAASTTGSTGTSGRVDDTSMMKQLTQPVRDDLLALRGQLQRFLTEAGSTHPQSKR